MNRTVSSLFSIATLTFIVLVGRSLQQAPLERVCLAALALIYLGIIWLPQAWWNPLRYSLAASLLAAIVMVLHLFYQGSESIPPSLLLSPLVLLLAREQQENRRFAAFLAALTLGIMVALSPGVSFVVTVIPSLLALYMSIRAINIYKVAYRRSQEDIQALDEAHASCRKLI
jgi:hypothetical protein